jgi:SAM-dependent methyltransferase
MSLPDLASTPWRHADAYERYMGRWSRQLAPPFLRWLAVRTGSRWLDVGCGTGALSAAILARCAPLAVTAVDPSEGFLRKAQQQIGDRVCFECASADALPLPDGHVDVTVSALMLNFTADPQAALAEMVRVTVAGGTVAAYVWDYVGRMDMIQIYWDAARALDPGVKSQDVGAGVAICQPIALQSLFEGGGLRAVTTEAIDIPMDFASFDDFWQPYLGGQGPAPAHAMGLTPPARARLCELLRARLPQRSDGSIRLAARAWSVRGQRPPRDSP